MAMRGRGNNANRPPRLIVGRVFEQFKPMSEWRQEDGYDTLLVYLPGFQKEYIKVTTEDVNIVRVRGERLVSENKWSRFQEDYQVPENCEMRGIRAKFDGGILTITMPRKIINAPPSAAATDRVAPKREQPQKPKEEPKEKKPDKPQTTRLEDKTLPPQPQPKPTSSSAPTKQQPLKPQTARLKDKTLPPQPKPTSSAPTKQQQSKPQTTRLKDNTLPPQPKPTSSSAPTKQQPPKLAPQAKKARDGFEHDVVEKPGVGKKTDLDKGKGKEAILNEETTRDFEGSKGKPNYSGPLSGGLRGVLARRGLVNEDRKLLVNVGVGVLMIVALGVHVSYTIGLIGKGK